MACEHEYIITSGPMAGVNSKVFVNFLDTNTIASEMCSLSRTDVKCIKCGEEELDNGMPYQINSKNLIRRHLYTNDRCQN